MVGLGIEPFDNFEFKDSLLLLAAGVVVVLTIADVLNISAYIAKRDNLIDK